MSENDISLRALEPSDIKILLEIENNTSYWKYSNRTEPYSRDLLEKYVDQQVQDIFQVRQKKFVITNLKEAVVGFVDLFEFEPIHRRAGVGIILKENDQGKGFGIRAIKLLGNYAKQYLNINSLFANIAFENIKSIHAFETCGYEKVGLKKAWNFYQNKFHDEYLYQKIFT